MQYAALPRKQGIARHLLRQRMLERVLHLRECGALVDEIPRLEVSQLGVQHLVRQRRDMPDQTGGKLLSDDCQRLQQFLLRDGKPVDTGGQHALHGRRNMERQRGLLDPVVSGLAEQGVFLGQRLNHFLHEKWVPFGLRQDQQFQGRERGIVPQQRRQQPLCLRLAQRLQA
ncbi:hypothetical protein D3C72_1763150 [compost metagenome]